VATEESMQPEAVKADASRREKAERSVFHRDLFGSLLGILVFLGGVGLLLITFREAYTMFTVPPQNALNLTPGKPFEAPAAGNSLAAIVIKILLLLIMGIFGSLIANKGISLYTQSHGHKGK